MSSPCITLWFLKGFEELTLCLDYANPAYAALGAKALESWRSEWGAGGRFHETGLCFTADQGEEAYVMSSLDNVRALAAQEAQQKGIDVAKHIDETIKVLHNHQEILGTVKTGGANGTHGYLNRRSGWVDADASMRWLRQQVEAIQRVEFLVGTVQRLLFSGNSTVRGAVLADERELHADLTILAAGAWTPTLLDMRGILQATGQILTYIELSDDEAAELSKTPTQLNMSIGMTKYAGCFAIPPPHPSQMISHPGHARRLYWKIARHGYGYLNLVTIPNPEDPTSGDITISIPYTNPSTPTAAQPIPQEGLQTCREYMESILAPDSPLRSKAFALSRICHYTDTASGDWLLDYHPKYNKTLFLATGCCGHGFKFLPVIGDLIVDCLLGHCPDEFKEKWCWRDAVPYEDWPGDGSRGGRKGMILEEELKKSGHNL